MRGRAFRGRVGNSHTPQSGWRDYGGRNPCGRRGCSANIGPQPESRNLGGLKPGSREPITYTDRSQSCQELMMKGAKTW